MKKILNIVLTLAMLYITPTLATIPSSKMLVKKLPNGLKVILKKDDKPNVAVGMIWYKVGSADEPGGITGISHALEHMMFKGTETYPPNAYSKIIAASGGQENAFTSKDYTAYFAKINSTNLTKFLQLEADRMRHLKLNKKEFSKEINVVKEERRLRTDDSPQGVLYERFMAMMHLSAPYHHPVIGWMNDLNNMTVEDIQKWYQTWYAPNNATVVIVGDISIQETMQQIETYFGPLKPSILPDRKPQREPQGLGVRSQSIKPKVPTNVPMIMLGYNTPSLITAKPKWHGYALEVAASVLSGGNSARLPKELVRKQGSAIEASADYDLYARYDSQFTLFGVAKNINEIPKLKQALLSEVQRLRSALISPTELQRIKNQVIASKIYEKDSVFGQAFEIGLLETIGLGHQAGEQFVTEINAITPSQVKQVAILYFTTNNLSEITLIPNNAKEK